MPPAPARTVDLPVFVDVAKEAGLNVEVVNVDSRYFAAMDEFVVRETYSEEAPRVMIVVDRRPSMALYRDGRYDRAKGRLSSWILGIAQHTAQSRFRTRSFVRLQEALRGLRHDGAEYEGA